MFILQDVPQGKPGYRRLFGIATCQITMAVVVVEEEEIYVYFTNVPRGKPSYRRQFG